MTHGTSKINAVLFDDQKCMLTKYTRHGERTLQSMSFYKVSKLKLNSH